MDVELDEARDLRDQSRQIVAGFQAKYVELTEIRQLKIKHNNFLGFFFEVPSAQGERLLRAPFDATFTHRQTMADAMRFSTRELVELDAEIDTASECALMRENALFDALRARICAKTGELQRLSQSFARLDLVAALAELASRRDWTRPHVDASLDFDIKGGRHPVVEASLQARARPSRPTTAIFRAGGSPSSPALIWRVNQRSCGRTR